MTERPHQLHEVVVGDDRASWAAAGFELAGDRVVIDRTAIRLVGTGAGRGMRSMAVDAIPADGPDLDGLPRHDAHAPPPAPRHPNGVTVIDHLVVRSPDCDRTTTALEAAGIEARRVRTFPMGGATQRQTFFWLGCVILELVGPDAPTGDGPCELWGLALTAEDIDQTAAALGDHTTPVKDAVQRGRRITTIKTRDLDITTALAVMSPHPGR
jgi:hypothetical protein